jgi:hypothetical protein
VSGLAHYLEDEGLATVIVALVREHIVAMRPPRALWVPFELGRPFGPPANPQLQRRVLNEALALLDQDCAEPLLRDFSESAMYCEEDPDWHFPGTLDKTSLRAEVASLLPLWQRARDRSGRSSFGISGLTPASAVEFIERFYSSDPMPNPKGMATVSRARFAIDDIKLFYFEAAMAEGGHPSVRQLNDWFWEHTLAGACIREFQETSRTGNDSNLVAISESLVPAERTISFQRTRETNAPR